MKHILMAACLFLAASAMKRDFPAFDSAHANCAMETTFPMQPCSDLYDKFYDVIYSFSPEPQSKGYYRVKETQDNDYIWAIREAPVTRVVDDIMFVFVEKHVTGGFECQVQARSRTQSPSFFDFNRNYCNMWTVFRKINGYLSVATGECPWVPDNARKICAIY